MARHRVRLNRRPHRPPSREAVLKRAFGAPPQPAQLAAKRTHRRNEIDLTALPPAWANMLSHYATCAMQDKEDGYDLPPGAVAVLVCSSIGALDAIAHSALVYLEDRYEDAETIPPQGRQRIDLYAKLLLTAILAISDDLYVQYGERCQRLNVALPERSL